MYGSAVPLPQPFSNPIHNKLKIKTPIIINFFIIFFTPFLLQNKKRAKNRTFYHSYSWLSKKWSSNFI
jgi:hypothetical protein